MTIKDKLIDKLIEQAIDTDISDIMENYSLDIWDIVENALKEKLESMNEEQLLEYL